MFIEKSFSPLTPLPAESLNETDANIDHVRVEAAHKHLCFVSEHIFDEGIGAVSPLSVQFTLDGSPIPGVLTDETGPYNRINVDISGLPVGGHTLGAEGLEIRFKKTPDMVYLSWWCTIETVSAGSISQRWRFALRNLTVIAHLDHQDWT